MGHTEYYQCTIVVLCVLHMLIKAQVTLDRSKMRCHLSGSHVDCVCRVSGTFSTSSTVTSSRVAPTNMDYAHNDTDRPLDTMIPSYGLSGNQTSVNDQYPYGSSDFQYVNCRPNDTLNLSLTEWLCGLRNLTHLSIVAVENADFNWQRLTCLSQLQTLKINRSAIQRDANDRDMSICNVLEHIRRLRELRISGCDTPAINWDSIGATENLTDLVLSYNHLSNNLTLSLPYLERLDLSHNSLSSLQPNSFYDLWSIKLLNLSYNDISYIDAETFDTPVVSAVTNHTANSFQLAWIDLFTLDISHNNLTQLNPAIFKSPIREIRELFLGYNKLARLPRYSVEDLHALEQLDLSHNLIYWLDVGTFTNKKLKYIDLSHNKLKKIISMTFLYLPKLVRIDLSHNEINFIYKYAFYRTCKRLGRVEVNLSGNRLLTDTIWTLLSSFQHVLKGGLCPVDIDLTYNRVTHLLGDAIYTLEKYVEEGEFSFVAIWDLVSFNISDNPLNCDCQVSQEIQILRTVMHTFESSFSNPGNLQFYSGLPCTAPATCVGTEVSDHLRTEMCPVITKCPASCGCVTDLDRRVIHVNCSYKHLHTIPTAMPAGVRELYLSGNLISHIPHLINLANLTLIDLSHNQIASIPPIVWAQLTHISVVYLHRNMLKSLPPDLTFGPEVKHVTLRGNPFRCMCLDQSLRTKLRKYSHIISDVQHVTCNTGEVVVDLSDIFFQCSLPYTPLSITPHFNVPSFTFAAILAFGFILSTIIFFLRHKILSFFSHRLGRYQVHADNDCFQRYDMLLLYSDLDFDYVSEEFLPQVQERAPCYRICVPQKDWRPDTKVSENMAYSADISRCTVIILSRHFLDTYLTIPEFYESLLGVLQNPNNKTYCVSLEIMTLETHYPELHAAVQRHRMFKSDDLMFWETLFNVLPSGRRTNTVLHEDEEYVERESDPIIECEKY